MLYGIRNNLEVYVISIRNVIRTSYGKTTGNRTPTYVQLNVSSGIFLSIMFNFLQRLKINILVITHSYCISTVYIIHQAKTKDSNVS